MNKVMLCGRLGQDPELTYITNGTPVCKFSLATSSAWVDRDGQKQEKTEWHRVVVWGKQGENCAKYLAKGRQVLVKGEIQYQKYTDKQGVERYATDIKATSVEFLGSGESRADQGPRQDRHQEPHNSTQHNGSRSAPANVSLDDIPF